MPQLTPWQQSEVDAYLRAKYPGPLEPHGRRWLKSVSPEAAWLIAEADGCLFVDAQDRACLALPLAGQAKHLSIHLNTLELERRERAYLFGDSSFTRKEDAVAAALRADWTHVSFDEGGAVQTLVQLAVEDTARSLSDNLGFEQGMPEHLRFVHGYRRRFLNAQPATDLWTEMNSARNAFVSCKFSHLAEPGAVASMLIRKYRDNPYYESHFAPIERSCEVVAQSATSDSWRELLSTTLDIGPFAGWPDLTLVKDGRLAFCEVEGNDKIHISQLAWWAAVRPRLNVSAWITRVKEVVVR